MLQSFREIAENQVIENFRDKNFVIATFFHDYYHAAACADISERYRSAHNFTWLGVGLVVQFLTSLLLEM